MILACVLFLDTALAQTRGCTRKRDQSSGAVVNREVGVGSHSLSHSYPVPDKPCGFCGLKAPRTKKER